MPPITHKNYITLFANQKGIGCITVTHENKNPSDQKPITESVKSSHILSKIAKLMSDWACQLSITILINQQMVHIYE